MPSVKSKKKHKQNTTTHSIQTMKKRVNRITKESEIERKGLNTKERERETDFYKNRIQHKKDRKSAVVIIVVQTRTRQKTRKQE